MHSNPPSPRPLPRSNVLAPWMAGLIIGGTAGLVFLGIGSRIAMRGIAHATNAPPGFSIGGTATVVFLGVAWGVGAGLLYVLLHRLFPTRRLVRVALFAIAIALLTARGLRGSQPLDTAVQWLVPLVIAYGVAVDVGYSVWHRRRRS